MNQHTDDLRTELRVAMLIAGVANPEQAVDVVMDVLEKRRQQAGDEDRKEILESKVARIIGGALKVGEASNG